MLYSSHSIYLITILFYIEKLPQAYFFGDLKICNSEDLFNSVDHFFKFFFVFSIDYDLGIQVFHFYSELSSEYTGDSSSSSESDSSTHLFFFLAGLLVGSFFELFGFRAFALLAPDVEADELPGFVL